MHKLISKAGELKFSNCDGCEKNCCTANGNFSLAPLILNDFEEVYTKFPILFAYMGQTFKCVMLINNGKDDCIYFDKNSKKCTIYEKRPPACILYPISPLFDDICVDVDCKAVGYEGEFLCNKDGFSKNFYHPRMDNFYKKLQNTQKFLNQVRFETKKNINLLGIDLFELNDDIPDLDDEFKIFIKMHKESLSLLSNYN
jgi:Fe-S-cluster containining protein